MLELKIDKLNENLEKLISLLQGEVKSFPAAKAAEEKKIETSVEIVRSPTFDPNELRDRCLALVKKDRKNKQDIRDAIKGITGKDNCAIADVPADKRALLDAALTALEAS